jgi:hypothetical protein
MLAVEILAGNMLLPVFLRLVIWTTRALAARVFAGRHGSEEGIEVDAMAKDAVAAGFGHSAVFAGLSSGENVTNVMFMVVNVRQTGRTPSTARSSHRWCLCCSSP